MTTIPRRTLFAGLLALFAPERASKAEIYCAQLRALVRSGVELQVKIREAIEASEKARSVG